MLIYTSIWPTVKRPFYTPLPPISKEGEFSLLMISGILHMHFKVSKETLPLFTPAEKNSKRASWYYSQKNLQLKWLLLPVWVLMCPWSSQGLEKALPQILQTQGSVWVLMCILSAPRLTYSLSQYLQLNDFLDWASQCSCLCLANPENVE